MTQKDRLNWTIIGGGNGGQSVAGHLGFMNQHVKLYDIFEDTINVIHEQGGIYLDGQVSGFGKIAKATTDLQECLEGADIIMVVTPALSHRAVAQACAPYLQDGQVVFLHPGATFGALAFKQALSDQGCTANVTVAESNTLIYACRLKQNGSAFIAGIKNKLLVSAIPAQKAGEVVAMLNSVFPQIEAVPNVLYTSFDNTNPMVHPGPTLLGVSLIESNREWLYYRDGITPSISQFIEDMDHERMVVGKAFGLELLSLKQQYAVEYGVSADTLYEVFQKTEAYDGIKGFHQLKTRYLLEDIPMGLLPLVELGKQLGVPVGRMETVLQLGEFVLKQDLRADGRSLKNLGIAGMTKEEIIHYLETGVKQQNEVGENYTAEESTGSL